MSVFGTGDGTPTGYTLHEKGKGNLAVGMNKVTLGSLAGALVTVLLWYFDREGTVPEPVRGALVTIVTAILFYWIPESYLMVDTSRSRQD